MKKLTYRTRIACITVALMLIGITIGSCAQSSEIVESTNVVDNVTESTADSVTVGLSSTDFTRMNYHDVVVYLGNRGFSNISIAANADIEFGVDYVEDEVSEVIIGDQNSFTSNDAFLSDVSITVYYHSIADVEIDGPDSYIGQDYNVVVDNLQSSGFTNIELERCPVLSFGYLHADGEVGIVEVNGQTDFESGDSYPSGALINLIYYTFPDEGESRPADSELEIEILTMEEYADFLEEDLQNLVDEYSVEFNNDDTIRVTLWGEGPEELISLAEDGEEESMAAWESFVSQVKTLCCSLYYNFNFVNADDPHLELMVLGDTEESDIILTFYDDGEMGYQVYSTPTPTPTNTPTPTPTNTPTPTPTPTPTNTPTPTPVPITRYAFQMSHPTYIQYFIIDTETHTVQYFTSYDQYATIETYSGDITSEQVACYCNGEFIEYLQISPSGHSLIVTEYDGYQYQFNYCSLATAESVLNGDN